MLPYKFFLNPRYWPTWLELAFLRLSICLPLRYQRLIGRATGRLLCLLLSKRRHIVKTNIALCFPEHSPEYQAKMVAEVFENNAIGFFETAMAWWSSPQKLSKQVKITGLEHIEQAQAQGKGVLLIGAHYSTLDLGGFLFGQTQALSTVYRPHNNELLDYFLRKGRGRFTENLIDNRNTRGIIRSLKTGNVVWIAPDQDMGPKHSIYVPFFGQDAATVTTVTKLARLSKAKVMTLAQYRLPKDQGYELRVSPPLEAFPSDDEYMDTCRVNTAIEEAIRKYPTQYMWVHRRFKTHPKGKGHLYRTLDKH